MTGFKLVNLDIAAHLKSPNIGNGACLALQQSKTSELHKQDFINCCLKIYVALVTKLQERCHLNHSFLRSLKALNSSQMVERPASSSTALRTIKKLVSAKQRSSDECDAAEIQYKDY